MSVYALTLLVVAITVALGAILKIAQQHSIAGYLLPICPLSEQEIAANLAIMDEATFRYEERIRGIAQQQVEEFQRLIEINNETQERLAATAQQNYANYVKTVFANGKVYRYKIVEFGQMGGGHTYRLI